MTKDDILKKVTGILEDALGADPDDVKPNSRLMADLGAESIDFLDIVFRLEKEFGLPKIDRNELFPESIFQGEAGLVKDGLVTPQGLAELKVKMPFADPAAIDTFAKNPKLESIGDLFTVDLICRFVEMKLKAKAA
ncbi:MAG: phosphopantetheine-binding protein [Gemmataceae bacterium]